MFTPLEVRHVLCELCTFSEKTDMFRRYLKTTAIVDYVLLTS